MKKRGASIHHHFLPIFLGLSVLAVGALYSVRSTIIPPPSVLGTTDKAATTVGAKEFFVPFGYSIVNGTSEWTDVAGMQATIDSSLYPKIKQVVFEATVFVPTGNQTVWLRTRDYDGFSYATVTMDGTGPKFLTSSSFSLNPGAKSPGPKAYYVQIKTQLTYPVHIYQARLHITTY